METIRRPNLLDVTRGLYAPTWGAEGAGRAHPAYPVSDAPKRPKLLFYVDRASMRLPASCLQPLLDSCPCVRCRNRRGGAAAPPLAAHGKGQLVIRIRLPAWLVKERQAQQQQLAMLGAQAEPDVYEVERVVGARRDPKGGRWQYRVRWKGWGEEDDTWEPKAHLVLVDEEMRARLAFCEGRAKETRDCCWIDDTPLAQTTKTEEEKEEEEEEEEEGKRRGEG